MKSGFIPICLLLLPAWTAVAHASYPTWQENALRFTAESGAVKDQAIKNLRAMPKLTELLRAQLRETRGGRALLPTQTFLAFDVISTLKLSALLPDLMEFAQTDSTGFSFHAINGLVSDQNRSQIVSFYRERLLAPGTSLSARMALLDTLSRFRSWILTEDLKRLVSDQPPLASTVLSYARSFLLRGERDDVLSLVGELRKHSDPLVRAEVIFLLSELSPAFRLKAQEFAPRFCRDEPVATVQKLCIERLSGAFL